jgi:hypothetical protein
MTTCGQGLYIPTAKRPVTGSSRQDKPEKAPDFVFVRLGELQEANKKNII